MENENPTEPTQLQAAPVGFPSRMPHPGGFPPPFGMPMMRPPPG